MDAAGWLALATIGAILMGPIAAVFVTRVIDDRREKHRRRYEVFSTLMRTRRTPVSPEHVGALNLVELEFYGVENVMRPFKALLSHFGTQHAPLPGEQTDPTMSEDERRMRDGRFQERIADERARKLAVLLHAIAKEVGYKKIEQIEIFEGGYTPQGWGNIEFEQSIIRRYFVDLYLGRRVVPISVFPLPEQNDPSA